MCRIARFGIVCWTALILSASSARAVDTDVVINEIFYLGTAAEDWVELKNTGIETIDVSSWWLCARFNYNQLSSLPLLDGDDLVLEPGEIITVGAGGNLNDVSSDLGLYTFDDFDDPIDMVDFVQWGTSTDVGRPDVAADKGIWTEVSMDVYDFAPTAGAGEALAYCGTNSGGGLLTLSDDLANSAPTRGAENTVPCPLFGDGFESGDTSGWSSAAPRQRLRKEAAGTQEP